MNRLMALETELKAFDAQRGALERRHNGEWVVFHNTDLVGTSDSFESAATEAVRQFGRGPYLIRQVGAPEIVLPASVIHRLTN